MQADTTHSASEQELPLFPLENVVLFPGGILPLHIFEPRYRSMIQFCLENESFFGVVLIKEGQEVGDPAEPYSVGTAVQIRQADRLQDGRMHLITAGQYRFEITEIQQERPYLIGQIRVPSTADIEDTEEIERITKTASQLYLGYESLLEKLIFGWQTPNRAPTHPHHLAYQIGTRLQVPMAEKQQLLETFPINQLLKREISVLKKEMQRLKSRLVAWNN